MKRITIKKKSTKKESVGIDKHKMWGMAGVVFFILVVAILVGYPLMRGKKGAVGKVISSYELKREYLTRFTIPLIDTFKYF